MRTNTEKAEGLANQAAGKFKQGVGEALGSDKMKVSGKIQEVKGKAQESIADVKHAASKASERMRDKI